MSEALKIGDICNITTGKLDSNQFVSGGKYPFFTCSPTPLTINSYAYDDSVILIAGNNANGNFHINRFTGKFNAYQRTYILTAKPYYDLDYIYYSLKLELKRLKEKSQGSQTKFLTMPILKDISIAKIDLNQQRKISAVFSTFDSKIELNNRINTELETMAKTLYDYWFVQFDFPDENGKPYKTNGGKMIWNDQVKREIPEGWEVKRIDEVIAVKDGTHESPKKTNYGFRLITSKNLKVEGLDFENANFISEEDYISINKRSKVDNGDILFSMIGNIGTVYKVEELEINFSIKNLALYKTSKKAEYINFIYMYLRSDDMKRYMANTISGSIQKFVGLSDLRSMPIFINNDYIKKYEEATKPIFLKLTNIKFENQIISELRDWLLPMLMNGQVKFKDEIKKSI